MCTPIEAFPPGQRRHGRLCRWSCFRKGRKPRTGAFSPEYRRGRQGNIAFIKHIDVNRNRIEPSGGKPVTGDGQSISESVAVFGRGRYPRQPAETGRCCDSGDQEQQQQQQHQHQHHQPCQRGQRQRSHGESSKHTHIRITSRHRLQLEDDRRRRRCDSEGQEQRVAAGLDDCDSIPSSLLCSIRIQLRARTRYDRLSRQGRRAVCTALADHQSLRQRTSALPRGEEVPVGDKPAASVFDTRYTSTSVCTRASKQPLFFTDSAEVATRQVT